MKSDFTCARKYRESDKVETELKSLLANSLCQFPKTLANLARQEQAEADNVDLYWPDAAVRLGNSNISQCKYFV